MLRSEYTTKDVSAARRQGGIVQTVSNHNFVFGLWMTYLFLTYFRPQYWIPAISAIRPGLLIAIVLMVFTLVNIKAILQSDSRVKLLLLFLGLAAASVPFAVNQFWAFQATQSLTLTILAVVLPMAYIIRSPNRLEAVTLAFVALSVYVAVFALTHAGKGPGSFIKDENDTALALNIALPFAYFLATSGRFTGLKKLLLLGACVVMVAAIVATMSRGGFVGLACVGAAIIAMSAHKIRNILVILLSGMLLFQFAPEEYKQEVYSINDTEDRTRTGRLFQWKMGWQMYLDNPVFGVGVGNYPWRVAEYEIRSGEVAPNGRLHGGRAAHSMYFTLIPETGTVGTLIFLLIAWKSIRSLLMLRAQAIRDSLTSDSSPWLLPTTQALLCAFGGYLTTSVFISTLYYPQFWFLVGFSICVLRIASSASRQDTSG